MRARAVAVASDRSNAVGPLELECTDEGLVIVHRGVGAYHPGYAPGAVTSGTVVRVPWPSVREAAWEGDRLFLLVDESLTPHHRLLLSSFGDAEQAPPGEERKRRVLLRVGTVASAVTAGLLTTVTVTRLSGGGGVTSALLLGCLGAGLILAVGLVADQRLGGGDSRSDAARAAFGMALSLHLPGLAVSPPPRASAAPPPQGRAGLPTLPLLLPRSTTAVVITMSAALLAAVLTASWLSRKPTGTADARAPSRPEMPAARIAEAPAAPSPAPAKPPRPVETASASSSPGAETALLAGACTCKRADSVLWRNGLPRVTTILIERSQRAHKDHLHTELEIGVVNNSDAPIPEVSLLVQFYEKDPPPGTKRVPTFDRPLFFEGPLTAGQAIKWHVEARGNDFEVTGAPAGHLDPTGGDAAPTGILVDLLKANHRPVRLHGAMMLAYLGDPRAKEGALGLREALREDEAPYIDRLMWAMSDVRTCDVQVEGTAASRTVKACVFNASKEPKAGLAMRLRALDHAFRHDTPVEVPPVVVAERVLKLSGTLGPNEGAFAAAAVDTSNPDGVDPKAFEVYADREELVF